MSSTLCRDCANYCVYCQTCHKDHDYHDFNDSCKDFEPEISEIEGESEVSDVQTI
jgi:glutaredoxin-related protein